MAGTRTPYKNLYTPVFDEEGWDDEINGNFEIIDTELHTLETGLAGKAGSEVLTAIFEIGDVKWSARSTPSTGWLLCSGQAVSRSTYAALFAAIGTAFGVGDGSTTFNLPAGGKVPVGYLSGDSDFGTLGKTGGEKTHLLTGSESGIQAHKHTCYVPSGGSGGMYSTASGNTSPTDTSTTGPTDATNAHNNLQPYQVFNLFIKYA